MCSHEQKNCPRCNSKFECKVGSINLCQCTTVILNDKEREYMRENFDDCLCASCMKDIKSEYHTQVYHNKLKSILGVFYRKYKKFTNDKRRESSTI